MGQRVIAHGHLARREKRTADGVGISDEFNVLIESESFAHKAEADFRQIEKQSEPFEKLKY